MKFNPSDRKARLIYGAGKEVIVQGKYLGRSNYQKDCYWSCHQYMGNYYISLNAEYDDVWPADEEDIEMYVEVLP